MTQSNAALAADPVAEEAVQALLAMQAEFFDRLKAANAAGDNDAVAALMAEFQARARALAGETGRSLSLASGGTATPKSIYDNSLCQLDLDLSVYDGDRDAFIDLWGDPLFKEFAEGILAEAEPFNARKSLLKTALKLTPKLAPQVHGILDRCRKNLGLTAEIELYVCPDVHFNAFCYPPANGRYLIGVTSALLEKFDADELAFIIGHEIGHALFRHDRLPVQFLLANGHGALTPLHAMKLYAWKRNAELSADRIGLLSAKSFDAAARAFFKLSSGVTDASLSFQLKEYIAQFTDLQSEMAGGDVDPEDWYSTHPFSPLRLKALDMFHRSATYFGLAGVAGDAELSESVLESEIKKIMSMMEPSYLSESSELATYMRNFVFNAGYLVAAANGRIDPEEIEALGSLLDPSEVKARLEAMSATNVEAVRAEVAALADKLNVMLPTVSKLNLIKDLSIIAGADGSVEDSEKAVLYSVCDLLQIRQEFVDHVLAGGGTD